MSTIDMTHVVHGSTSVRAGGARPVRVAATGVRSHLRLTRRGRVVVTLLAALPILVVVLLAVLNGGQAAAGSASADVHFEHVTVQPGETLWQLAQEEAPNADPREFVQDVVDLNALDGASLQAGQRIAIPVEYTSGH